MKNIDFVIEKLSTNLIAAQNEIESVVHAINRFAWALYVDSNIYLLHKL